MTTLALLVCLIASPDQCRRVPIEHYDTKQACLVDAIPQAAKWVGDHPDYRFRRATCADGQPT